MATSLYPPLHIRDIPGPQPGQFGLVNNESMIVLSKP
jgi:hypothetical protein